MGLGLAVKVAAVAVPVRSCMMSITAMCLLLLAGGCEMR